MKTWRAKLSSRLALLRLLRSPGQRWLFLRVVIFAAAVPLLFRLKLSALSRVLERRILSARGIQSRSRQDGPDHSMRRDRKSRGEPGGLPKVPDPRCHALLFPSAGGHGFDPLFRRRAGTRPLGGSYRALLAGQEWGALP